MNKLISFTVSLLLWTAHYASAQQWIDVTDTYITNPRYDNNDLSGWAGTQLGAYYPKENAEHYQKTYDTYQMITGLIPGKYRVSLQAFYRMGSASYDYSRYTSGSYSYYQYAQLYAASSTADYYVAIKPASSGMSTTQLGGNTSTVGGKYIPNNMEAAYYWFKAGYYNNSVECEVGEDGKLIIGIRKYNTLSEDWTCIDNWKLEYWGDIGSITPVDPSSENVIINEIMSANVDVYRDPSTNFGSWVEIYNPSDKTVNLGGLYVSDDEKNLKQFRLNSNYGMVRPNSYALLNFDHHDQWTALSWRQIDTKLNCEGGKIIISDGVNVIAQMTYPKIASRASYARKTDGTGDWGFTTEPTPGSSNTTSAFATAQLAAPTVTPQAQLFSSTLSVKVDIPEGCTLRYTTDGSTPTLSNGNTSTTGSFNVSSTTCYRFRLYKEGMLASTVVTRSYIKNSGNEPFPIISIVTDKSNIFNSEYAVFQKSNYGRPGNGQGDNCNWNMDWDRPVNFEYITTDNECVVSQECDFSACGGWSRAWEPHSFKLKATKAYDLKNSFSHQFFDEKPYLKHKTLQIRNGGNDTGCRIKDASIQQVLASSGLYLEHQAWQPVHVFFNGEPYAVLNMREPNNKHYGYANYGIDTDLMDQFEICPDSGYVQKEGTKDSFDRWYTLAQDASNEASYTEICKLVDIDEYVNYMAAELYIGSTDWPQNNVKGFRSTEDGKFRFVLFDLDGAFATSTPFSTFFNKENYTFDKLYGIDYSTGKTITGTRLTKENEFVTIFRNMLSNETFRRKFIDAYCIMAGSVCTPKRANTIVTEMANYLNQGKYVDPWYTANSVINSFSASRQNSMITQLKNCSYMKISSEAQSVTLNSNIPDARISINSTEIPTGEFSGKLFYPVTLTASAPAGYNFAGWTSDDGSIESKDSTYTLSSGNTKLTAVWEKKTDSELADATFTPIRVNEVSAGNDMYVNEYFKKEDWIELYNNTDCDLDVAGLYISDDATKPMKYQIQAASDDISTIIPARGHLLVWADKQLNSSKLHTTFKLGNKTTSVVLLTSSEEFVANNAAFFSEHPSLAVFADKLTYEPHNYDQSVGRYPDGANEFYVMNRPTIGKANSMISIDSHIGTDNGIVSPLQPGDMNKDGRISIADITQLIQMLSNGTAANKLFHDIDGNGIVDKKDIEILSKTIILGKPRQS